MMKKDGLYNLNLLPKWARELEKSLITNSQFLMWGNIYDIYPVHGEDNMISLMELSRFLNEIFIKNEYDAVLYFEPIGGISLISGDEIRVKDVLGINIKKGTPLKLSLSKLADLLEQIDIQRELSIGTIFNYGSRLDGGFISSSQLSEFYYKLFRILQNSTPKRIQNRDFAQYNIICILVDKENDIPAWYITDNKKIKNILISKPDFISRRFVIKSLFRMIRGFNEASEEQQRVYESIFIDQTNELYLYEIKSIVLLALKENIYYTDILEAVNRYKLGIIENEWAKISYSKLLNARSILSKSVMGQDSAIIKVSDILKRAYFNLSGSQFSKYPNKPKGIMFFAGPTGVGKTELAKSITKLIFGNESSYIRFDMSEFSAEHTSQRLLGAPPGYVGYETGGELINAIKKNPFSVILFDEIEKAHPKIMDVFLQILDDGRITSAKGETVYFNETIIIFTSNLGVYSLKNGGRVVNIDSNMDYDTVSKTILYSIDNYFKHTLQRPEILNRIGQNIVVFDFIRKDIAQRIFNKMLSSILDRLQDGFNIKLSFKRVVLDSLRDKCLSDLSMGGRGVGNRLEDIFINPLSRALFEINAKNGDKLIINNFEKVDNQWVIELIRKSI
jgi:ATP-dependent Clp protease ATP-binding subunit ClpA